MAVSIGSALRHAAALTLLGLTVAEPVQAAEDAGSAPRQRQNPFACYGAAESIARNLSAAQIALEVEKQLTVPAPEDETGPARAVRLCTTAELMRRVGDPRASEQYEAAIAAAPDEPGFELWYADYLRNVRGPGYPLLEPAEIHYDRALEKLAAIPPSERHPEFDNVTEDWVRRGMINLFQEDGLPLLPGKAHPAEPGDSARPGLFLTAMLRTSYDTSDFNAVDDARKFTSEATFAQSQQRLNRALDRDELRALARTPLRTDVFTRLRLRLGQVGAIDVSYKGLRIKKGQINYFTEPTNFGDVQVDEFGLAFKRSIAVGTWFDFLADVRARRVIRTGVVEWFPTLRESINLLELKPVIARFVGPDKISAGVNYVYMDIPFIPGGKLEDRRRGRAIRALWGDYAMYRPVVFPFATKRTWTRGLHVYGGYVFDDEVYGVRLVKRRDAYLGTSLRGLGAFDVTLQGGLFSSETSYREATAENATVERIDGSQTNAQIRPTVIVATRLIDEEAIPGMPPGPLAMLNLVIPIRHDFAYRGLDSFENTRAGVELWAKVLAPWARGTNFLVTLGYDAQWFHRLDKLVHMGHLDLRMGWDFL